MNTLNDPFQCAFYSHLETFLSTREHPERDRCLIETKMDGHHMSHHPGLLGLNKRASTRNKVLITFREYLESAGVTSSRKLIR